MSVAVRRATVADLPAIQTANLACLPENYHLRYYLYHVLSWPQLSWVAEDSRGNVVGYVLAKMEDDDAATADPHGHITSLAVLRTHRKLGVATRLMEATQRSMVEVYDGVYLTLHVRKTNRVALKLYRDTLGFRVTEVEAKYYADDEDAMAMRKDLQPEKEGMRLRKAREASGKAEPPSKAAENGGKNGTKPKGKTGPAFGSGAAPSIAPEVAAAALAAVAGTSEPAAAKGKGGETGSPAAAGAAAKRKKPRGKKKR